MLGTQYLRFDIPWKKEWSAYYIWAVVFVGPNLQRIVVCDKDDEDGFVRPVMENKTATHAAERERAQHKLDKQQQCIEELDAIIRRIYEDHAMGKLTAERFAKLSEGYEKEQAELKLSVDNLRAIVNETETQQLKFRVSLKLCGNSRSLRN